MLNGLASVRMRELAEHADAMPGGIARRLTTLCLKPFISKIAKMRVQNLSVCRSYVDTCSERGSVGDLLGGGACNLLDSRTRCEARRLQRSSCDGRFVFELNLRQALIEHFGWIDRSSCVGLGGYRVSRLGPA